MFILFRDYVELMGWEQPIVSALGEGIPPTNPIANKDIYAEISQKEESKPDGK